MKCFGNDRTVDVELAFLQWIPDTNKAKGEAVHLF